VGPTVEIERVPLWPNRWRIEEIKDTPELPAMGDPQISTIRAGASSDDLADAARKSAYSECDETTAEILAEAMYHELPKEPILVEALGKKGGE
jgi:hypothetical protein